MRETFERMTGRMVGPDFFLNGLPVIARHNMTDTVEDWSGCRSVSRAMRRAKQGHKQRVRYIEVPKKELLKVRASTFGPYGYPEVYIGHPETIRALIEATRGARMFDI